MGQGEGETQRGRGRGRLGRMKGRREREGMRGQGGGEEMGGKEREWREDRGTVMGPQFEKTDPPVVIRWLVTGLSVPRF